MAALVKLALAVLLPISLYVSTVNLPLRDASWLGFINNTLWIATALYFVVYLPIKGLGMKNWVAKVLVALLAVSLLTTSFQTAVKHRQAQYELQK